MATALGLSAMSALSGVVIGTILQLLSGIRLGSLLPVVEAALAGLAAGPVVALIGAYLATRAAAVSPRLRTRALIDDVWFYAALLIGGVVGLVVAFALIGR